MLCLPVIALLFIAASGDSESFYHIYSTILPRSSLVTLLLLIGVGLFVAITGFVTAWLVTFYEFPARKWLQWLLMLPLAVPTYISAYSFVEFFSFTGPLQETVRSIGGFQSPREYWFPEIRSLGGTVFVLGVVLYPYVYLSVRTLFRFQGSNVSDCARVLGASGFRLLRSITLPLARPAIILGVTLALMETINDIGAVEYLGTQTLTFSIFSVWLNQNNLAGAAQIALFMLAIVIVLLLLERASRGRRKYHDKKVEASKSGVLRLRLNGPSGLLAAITCLLPVGFGFGVPVYVLTISAWKYRADGFGDGLFSALITSVSYGAVAAVIAVIVGVFLTYAVRINNSKALNTAVRISASGYAVPGTLIALGIFLPLANFDNGLDAFMRSYLGVSTGLLLTGSGFAMIFAYVVRFIAIAEGNLANGFSKISPNIDMAGRTLGRTRLQVLTTILLPVLRPAILGAGLLVFVEVIKELSATIMLRPFGVNTLATYVYDYASQARVSEAALACLLIIAAGMIPVILLLGTGAGRK